MFGGVLLRFLLVFGLNWDFDKICRSVIDPYKRDHNELIIISNTILDNYTEYNVFLITFMSQ